MYSLGINMAVQPYSFAITKENQVVESRIFESKYCQSESMITLIKSVLDDHTIQFDQLSITYLNSCANFITFYLGSKTQQVYELLLSEGVILRPLQNYGLADYLRVTIGTQKENTMFILPSLMNQ